MQAIKLTNLYRRNFNTNNTGSTGLNMSDWLQFSDDHLIRERLELEQVSVLSQTLHSYNMQLMVEIPAMETLSDDGMMSLFLIQVLNKPLSESSIHCIFSECDHGYQELG